MSMQASAGSRILVTGASGFIGQPCLELLVRRGWEVHAISSRRRESEGNGVCWRRADLLEPGVPQAMIRAIRPSHLLHLAWSASAANWATHPDNFRWVRSSLELLEEFADQGGQRAVFTGSCAEYDWQDGLCSEATTVLRPTTTYGLCKHVLGELFNHRVGREGSALSGAWARLFYLFGPREAPRRLLPSVVNSLLRGEQAHCSHAQQRRDYLFVADAADALVTLLESRVQGPINIASGEAPRVSEIIQRTAGKLAGQDLVRLGSLPTPDNDPPLIVADVERQSSELGWRPRWNLDNALDQTIAWWRDQQQTSSLE